MQKKQQKNKENKRKNQKDVCKECGAKMRPEGGCFVCPNCGYSPCHI
ncbi:hypothetical protein [Clostridiisalibacter paucivorans]|nr:hypothetical protein [Clostridiisalibacter paucivorans]